jgi:dihydroneopterin aldolase
MPDVSSADRILISGLRAVGRHGVLAQEQASAQPFEVDLELAVDLRAAGTTDELANTVDYGAISETVAAIVANESYALLERLATRIADACREDERVQLVTVTVKKLRPPIPVDVAHTAVRITR